MHVLIGIKQTQTRNLVMLLARPLRRRYRHRWLVRRNRCIYLDIGCPAMYRDVSEVSRETGMDDLEAK